MEEVLTSPELVAEILRKLSNRDIMFKKEVDRMFAEWILSQAKIKLHRANREAEAKRAARRVFWRHVCCSGAVVASTYVAIRELGGSAWLSIGCAAAVCGILALAWYMDDDVYGFHF